MNSQKLNDENTHNILLNKTTIIRKLNGPFIPAIDYSDFISLKSFAGMNGRLELGILTQPYSEVYCGYFRLLVFGNSLTKHNKLTSFSYSVVIFFSRFPTSDWSPWYRWEDSWEGKMGLVRICMLVLQLQCN